MTARELYEQACLLVYEIPDDDEDLKSSFPAFLNQLMGICVPYENQFRAIRGQTKLSVPPLVQEVDDTEIPLCEEICRMALLYGIQSKFLEADDDKKAESVLAYNRFVEMLNNITPAVEMEFDMDDSTD